MEDSKKKIIRITTVPQSLRTLLKGQLKFMKNYYSILAVSSDGSCFDHMVQEQEVEAAKVYMSRKITPFRDLVSLWHLIRLFHREKPYIVHTHTPKAGLLGMLAAYICRVPHRIHTVAGLPLLEASGNKRRLLNVVERITYACATKVYPNSFALRDIIIQNNLAKKAKVDVIANGSSNGIDTSYFSPEAVKDSKDGLRARYKIDKDDFVFIFVGRMVGDKGINELVAAFYKLNQIHPSAKLLLVGPLEEELDPLKSETKQLIETHTSIISVGFQNDVRPFLKMADALVFPSYREGFPNVVMQAGAMGLPSIVSDINGCNEIIIDGENGVIIPKKDVEKLYDAMMHFLEDKELLKLLTEKSRALIQNRYEQKDVWEAILKMYQSLEQL